MSFGRRDPASAKLRLELKLGASALWQALGFTAAYVALLLFVPAPLRPPS